MELRDHHRGGYRLVRLLDELEPQRRVDDNRADPRSAPASPALAATPFPSVTIIRGLPPNAIASSAFEAYAVWAGAGRMYVVTFGSSSCPNVPTGVSVSADNRLTVTAKPHE
ncbi:MAG TPA: hypothetical protein VI110_10665 [Lapillicoccus sp.]